MVAKGSLVRIFCQNIKHLLDKKEKIGQRLDIYVLQTSQPKNPYFCHKLKE